MADGCQGLAPAPDSGSDTSGTGALARHLAAGPRLDGLSHGECSGTGSSHHRTLGSRLGGGWTRSLDFRADWGFPHALGERQQEGLKTVVQEVPASAGIGLANWTWREGRPSLAMPCVWCRFPCPGRLTKLGRHPFKVETGRSSTAYDTAHRYASDAPVWGSRPH